MIAYGFWFSRGGEGAPASLPPLNASLRSDAVFLGTLSLLLDSERKDKGRQGRAITLPSGTSATRCVFLVYSRSLPLAQAPAALATRGAPCSCDNQASTTTDVAYSSDTPSSYAVAHVYATLQRFSSPTLEPRRRATSEVCQVCPGAYPTPAFPSRRTDAA